MLVQTARWWPARVGGEGREGRDEAGLTTSRAAASAPRPERLQDTNVAADVAGLDRLPEQPNT